MFAFSAVIFAAPIESRLLLRAGSLLIGFGGGLFRSSTLIAAMSVADSEHAGLVIGGWGAVQATAAGVAIALGGAIRDGTAVLAAQGAWGRLMAAPSTGYSVVWHLEIALLFATLIAIGPLIRDLEPCANRKSHTRFGLAELPT